MANLSILVILKLLVFGFFPPPLTLLLIYVRVQHTEETEQLRRSWKQDVDNGETNKKLVGFKLKTGSERVENRVGFSLIGSFIPTSCLVVR